ncbi:MAG TPA: DUF885 domain-containing protein [Bryobacteraceae bacterium]|nr:DUF885 domain-containing protein [Bryobacteraceae bacterium]
MHKLAVAVCLLASAVYAAVPAWVQESNRNATILLETIARFHPETAGRIGMEGLDDRIVDLKPNLNGRLRTAYQQAAAVLTDRRAQEKNALVLQDLDILLKQVSEDLHGLDLQEKYRFAYTNVSQLIYGGINSLLDDQVPAKRRQTALVRLKRYTGLEPGYTAITQLAEERTRERLSQPGLLGPAKAQVEKDLSNATFFIEGIGKLFEKYKIAGYEQAYNKLREQLAAYNDFIRKEVLPKSREDFKLPLELYAYQLEQYGIDITPSELTRIAHAAFDSIQKEMEALAPRVAKEKGLHVTGYREVIAELKKNQLLGDAILAHYRGRISEIESIIRRERLVSLPERPASMRLATAAESAATPAPNMRPPRLLGNTGETGVFILPLNLPAAGGTSGETQKLDDFTFAAASWTLSSHEARPGHEMQFASMVEHGVSTARAVFAFNSTNVEGWGLYAEWIMKPYMPLEGQLISLQHRLLRAARAFLDPELHMGKIRPAEAHRVLREDVALSEGMTNSEVERYTFRTPGQATSYFYGFTRLLELRADTEKKLGAKFDPKAFHDFILAQGLLPPALLRKAVVDGFVAGAK